MSYLRIITIIAICSLLRLPAAQSEQKPAEYQVKAAFLYNFTKFVEWPKETQDKYRYLYILGDNPFGNELDDIHGKTVGGKQLITEHINSLNGLKECSILFVSSSEEKYLQKIIETTASLSILTIGDTNGYAEQGIIINLYTEQNKIRFEINTNAAKRSGLKLSSKILHLARIISF